MKEFPLAESGLIAVKDAADRKGWAVKSVQNWINAGLLPVAIAGAGMRRTYLLRIVDVDAFTPPARGRPVSTPSPKKNTKSRAPKKANT